MANISAHPATQDDLRSLKSILRDAVEYKNTKNDDAWGTEPWTDEEVAEAIGFGNTHIVTYENKVIGCFDLGWEDAYNWGEELGSDGQAVYLHRFALIKEYRGKDFGDKIIRHLTQLAKDKSRISIRLDCRSDNKSLCNYYEAKGFIRVKTGVPSNKTAYYEKAV